MLLFLFLQLLLLFSSCNAHCRCCFGCWYDVSIPQVADMKLVFINARPPFRFLSAGIDQVEVEFGRYRAQGSSYVYKRPNLRIWAIASSQSLPSSALSFCCRLTMSTTHIYSEVGHQPCVFRFVHVEARKMVGRAGRALCLELLQGSAAIWKFPTAGGPEW